ARPHRVATRPARQRAGSRSGTAAGVLRNHGGGPRTTALLRRPTDWTRRLADQDSRRGDSTSEQYLRLHHRLRVRPHSQRGRAPVAPRADRVGRPAKADDAGGEAWDAPASLRGRGLREVPPQDVLRAEALLDRRDRHAGSDARRDHPFLRGGGYGTGPDRHGAPGTAERSEPRSGQAVRADPRWLPRRTQDDRRLAGAGRLHG